MNTRKIKGPGFEYSVPVDPKDAEIERLKAENQRLKETLDTFTKEVAAAYMKALGPVDAMPRITSNNADNL